MQFPIRCVIPALAVALLASCAVTNTDTEHAGDARASVAVLTPAECSAMLTHQVIRPDNPVPCERLRRVSFTHIDFEGASARGNIVVLDATADQVAGIFSELYARRFPLKQALLMEHYQGNDDAAMNDNNTSAFNGRAITGGTEWSKHAWGVAIDINPLQNPYLAFADDGRAKVLPAASAKQFVNRLQMRPGKEPRAGLVEPVVDIFARHGFLIWGGDWNFPIDYQHFEIGSRGFISDLLKQTPAAARDSFNSYAQSYRDCTMRSSETDPAKKRAVCAAQVQK